MRCFRGRVFFVFSAMLLALSNHSRASDSELDSQPVYDVLAFASTGAMIGLGAGLVLWPISRRFNTVPVGLGVGACLGAAVGLYHVTHTDDPQNPFLGLNLDVPRGTGATAPVVLSYTLRF
ncbi:MAG: hypothetical protein KGQ59_00770 [Bdellovibrionales bacterium]|nr:hypothetical protein [Bdellovibrionales bacterium]